jgi:hypothetical protein
MSAILAIMLVLGLTPAMAWADIADGDGFSYASDTQTLTLDGSTIDSSGAGEDSAGIIALFAQLLVDNSSIKATDIKKVDIVEADADALQFAAAVLWAQNTPSEEVNDDSYSSVKDFFPETAQTTLTNVSVGVGANGSISLAGWQAAFEEPLPNTITLAFSVKAGGTLDLSDNVLFAGLRTISVVADYTKTTVTAEANSTLKIGTAAMAALGKTASQPANNLTLSNDAIVNASAASEPAALTWADRVGYGRANPNLITKVLPTLANDGTIEVEDVIAGGLQAAIDSALAAQVIDTSDEATRVDGYNAIKKLVVAGELNDADMAFLTHKRSLLNSPAASAGINATYYKDYLSNIEVLDLGQTAYVAENRMLGTLANMNDNDRFFGTDTANWASLVPKKLTTLIMPKQGDTYDINQAFFARITTLTSLDLSNVNFLKNLVLRGNTALKAINLTGITKVTNNAFNEASNIKLILLPDDPSQIGGTSVSGIEDGSALNAFRLPNGSLSNYESVKIPGLVYASAHPENWQGEITSGNKTGLFPYNQETYGTVVGYGIDKTAAADKNTGGITPGTEVVLSAKPSTFEDGSYQWYKDGVAISGATNATYTINSLEDTDEGEYTVAIFGLLIPGSERVYTSSFKVYKQTGTDVDNKTLIKEYNAYEFVDMADTDPLGFLAGSGHGASARMRVYATTQYVTLPTILSDAFDFEAIEDDHKIIISAPDGWTSNLSAEVVNGPLYYYPTATNQGDIEADDDGEIVPPVLAIKWASPDIATAAANALTAGIESSYASGNVRLLYGTTAEAYTSGNGIATNRFAQYVNSITLVEPAAFTISERTGNDAPKVVKAFNAEELDNLAQTNPRGFLHYGGKSTPNVWSLSVTDKYVPLSNLLSAANVSFAANDSVRPQASFDGFGTTLTYDAIQNSTYFYPATTQDTLDTTGAIDVSAVLALQYKTDPFSSTAGADLSSFVDAIESDSGYRFLMGLSEADYLSKTAPGNRFVTGPDELIVTHRVDVADVTNIDVAAIDQQVYTGSALTPEPAVTYKGTPLIKDTDYTLSYANNIRAGTAQVTVSGIGNFYGTTSSDFTILRYALAPNSGTPIAEGSYVLKSTGSLFRVLDVYGGAVQNGGNITQYAYHGDENQQFYVTQDDDGYYVIEFANTNQVLDISGASTALGTDVVQYRYSGSFNQKWYLTQNGDGSYVIHSALAYLTPGAGDLAIDIWGGADTNAAPLKTYTAHGGINQSFEFIPVEDAAALFGPEGDPINTKVESQTSVEADAGTTYYRIVPVHAPDSALDIYGGTSAPGSTLVQWNSHGNDNQLFYLVKDADGYYTIHSKLSGLALDVYGGIAYSGASVVQWGHHGQSNQQWVLRQAVGSSSEDADPVVSILSKQSNMAWDVWGASTTEGSPITTYPYHGGQNQQFKLVEVV